MVMGGQPWAQAPEQVDREDVSASNRYKVFPSGPTRNVPRLVFAVRTVTGWADCVALAEVDGVELFEHVAASRPMATTTIALPILELTMSSSALPPISPPIRVLRSRVAEGLPRTASRCAEAPAGHDPR